jgi:hypothetical protein
VIGRYVPSLRSISILLGDEEVLTPEFHFYQRLLASDQYEAKRVLDRYLEGHSLQELYDSVVIPALALAEQDRQRNDMDEATERFITSCTREIMEDLHCQTRSLEEQGPVDEGPTIACVAAQDEADELVGCIFSYLAEQAGKRAECFAAAPIEATVASIQRLRPDLICISALPPFGVSHAAKLYRNLCSCCPDAKILIALWNFPGDSQSLSKRLRLRKGDTIVMKLDQALSEIRPQIVLEEDEPETDPRPASVPA